ncbi:MAG: hypothetical protein GF417_08575 [Candidatus Latescibacteria bacterium]|nr:hypothetical protein [bacterium]MBD3424476.1 hypothetical protein [Candidatus Latescibacterota bacterium]
MATRIDRFERIADYYRQRKDAEVGRLHRIRRLRSERELLLKRSLRKRQDFINSCTGRLSGRINTAGIAGIEGSMQYLKMEIARVRDELDKALKLERNQREQVIQADIQRRVWEKLVRRKKKQATQRESSRNSKLMDDLALSRKRAVRSRELI